MATFTNQATLTYNAGAANSNIVTGEILDELSVTKTPVESNYSNGDTVTYVINIVNSGTTDYTGLTITDDLGAYTTPDGTAQAVPLTYVEDSLTYFTNGTTANGAAVGGRNPLAVTGINVSAGGNTTVVYSALVNDFAPLDAAGVITNTATLTGDGVATDVAATAVINAEPAPTLSISKAVNPTPIFGNGPLTYTFIITNTGNTAATEADNLSITDVFDPRLNISNVTLDGNALTEGAGDYTYDADTGTFTTTAGRITVPEATYTQNEQTGAVTINPGTSTLTVTGTVA